MIKQRPNVFHQSTMFTKKQKKRPSSTSLNKQNIPLSHNNSNSIQYSFTNEKYQQNPKSNKIAGRQKSKKPKVSQNKLRTISRISNENPNYQFIQQSKLLNVQTKQAQAVVKKPKVRKSDPNRTFLGLQQNKLNSKSHIIYEDDLQFNPVINSKRNFSKLKKPENSKSSSIISSSTGNIQFSDRSKDEHKQKKFQLLQSKALENQQTSVKMTEKFFTKKKKINPTKAAILIQKTWRGYLTRKLLEEYIESFEPLYEEQLKQIRSSRQSCHQIKFSSQRHEKSSFFEESELDECSQISSFQQGKNIEKNSEQKSSRRKYICPFEIPLQYSNKSLNKGESNKKFGSTNRSGLSNKQKIGISQKQPSYKENSYKVNQFVINNNLTSQKPSLISTFRNEETLRILNQKSKICCLDSNNISLSIKPQKLSHLQNLNFHCQSLQKLFCSLNVECMTDLKRQIRQNNLDLHELKQRKEALKDIIENGREFIKNVSDQITKAFKEMKRITVEGCDHHQQEESSEQSQAQQQQISHTNNQHQKSSFLKEKNYYNGQPEKHSNQKPNKTMKKTETQQWQTKQSSKKKSLHKSFTCEQEFCKIELPTEQYSIKGRSPIQQDFEESSESESQNEDTNSYKESHSSQSEEDEQNYPFNQQSIEILNQFLINLIDQYSDLSEYRNASELEYLCETLKRVSCDSQNKTIIDRCLIQFIVQIMSETWTLREIYDAFKCLVMRIAPKKIDYLENSQNDDSWKLYSMIKRWLTELQKWQMNIIKEVPSKMESSSFLNTENISVNDLREAVNDIEKQQNLDSFEVM